MSKQALYIKKGDADTFTETITGISSLSGYTAKMYIYDAAGTLKTTITGSISSLTVSYDITNDTTKAYDVGTYYFETKIFDESDHVYTQSDGLLIIEPANQTDPS
jgi:hypothetical protein